MFASQTSPSRTGCPPTADQKGIGLRRVDPIDSRATARGTPPTRRGARSSPRRSERSGMAPTTFTAFTAFRGQAFALCRR